MPIFSIWKYLLRAPFWAAVWCCILWCAYVLNSFTMSPDPIAVFVVAILFYSGMCFCHADGYQAETKAQMYWGEFLLTPFFLYAASIVNGLPIFYGYGFISLYSLVELLLAGYCSFVLFAPFTFPGFVYLFDQMEPQTS